MYLFGRTQWLDALSPQESLTCLHDLGFDGVEICFEHPGLNPATLDQDLIDGMKDKLSELQFADCSASYHVDLSDPVMVQGIKTSMDAAAQWGLKIFVMNSIPCSRSDVVVDAWSYNRDRTAELVAYAANLGLLLAVEPEPNFIIETTADFAKLQTEVPGVRMNLDIGHAFLTDEHPLESIASVAQYVVHGHIENMCTDVHAHRLPWEGDMNLPDYISVLAKAGFIGGLALDLYGMDYAAESPACIAYLKPLLAKYGSLPTG